MTIDSRQQAQFSMGYDPMRFPPAPQFTNPWASAAPPAHQSQMYATSLPATSVGDSQRYATHAPNVSSAYTGAPISAPSLATGILSFGHDFYDGSGLQVSQDGLNRQYGSAYSTAPAPSASAYAPTSGANYNSMSTPYGYTADRRPSHPLVYRMRL